MPLTLVDYPVLRLNESAPPPGPGYAVISFPPVPSGYLWRVDQLTASVIGGIGSGASPTVLLYDEPPGPLTVPIQGTTLSQYTNVFASASSQGVVPVWADFDDQGSPLTIKTGDQLSVVFEGVAAPQICGVRIQYGLYQGTEGHPMPVAGASPGPRIPVGL